MYAIEIDYKGDEQITGLLTNPLKPMKITDYATLLDRTKDTTRYQILETSMILETTNQIDGSYYVRYFDCVWYDLKLMSNSELCEWLESLLSLD